MSEQLGRVADAAVLAALALGIVLGGAPPVARAATIKLINRDGPGEGFNDPTSAAPVGGNTGTTIGEQRLIAFQFAVDKWASLLASQVEIRVSATFDPLQCDGNSVTLGQAGPVSAFRDFNGAPQPGTFYPSALADRLAGMDLAPDEDDIVAQFNSAFGTTCSFPAGWYNGLDGQPPNSDTDLVTVLLHELGHGLGFLTFVDIHTGALMNGADDAFLDFLVDDRTNKTFPEMTDAERRSAITATNHLKWNGPQVEAASGVLTTGADSSGRVEMYAPPQPVDGSSTSHWSDRLFPNELMEPILTGPIHNVSLALPALLDMGWNQETVAPCVGDCNGDGMVSINELIQAVGIALGNLPLSACPAVDADGNGTVAVNELVAAVGNALNGCPAAAGTPTVTPTAGPTPTPTMAGSCPVAFSDDSVSQNLLCVYIGRWNAGCGDDQLETSFSSDGSVFIAAIATDPLLGLIGDVASATQVTLSGWFTDFTNLSDLHLLSGSATLSAARDALHIQPASAPFTINQCDFVDYQGAFEQTATASLRATSVDTARLLSLARQKLGR
jgi:hypothetical protein